MPKITLLLVAIYVTSAGCRGRHIIALKVFLRGAFWWPDISAGARQKPFTVGVKKFKCAARNKKSNRQVIPRRPAWMWH